MYTHLDFIFIVQSVTVCIFVSFQIMEMLTDYNAQHYLWRRFIMSVYGTFLQPTFMYWKSWGIFTVISGFVFSWIREIKDKWQVLDATKRVENKNKTTLMTFFKAGNSSESLWQVFWMKVFVLTRKTVTEWNVVNDTNTNQGCTMRSVFVYYNTGR